LEEVGGKAAYYFDKNDTADLANAITKVMNSEALQNDLMKKGFKQAEKFSWQKTAEQTIAVYKKVLENK